jgi:hypothetical protein
MRKNIKIQEHKRTDNSCIYAILICAIMAAGCAQSTKGRLTVESSAPLGVKVQDGTLHVSTRHPMVEQNSNISMVGLMEVAEDVLTGMHFTIEKADVRSGLIRTRPLPGAQFFEFWRSDNVGIENWIQANIHSIRRTVELYINQNDENINIDCDVLIQRLSLPNREIPGSAQAYQLFSRSSMLMQTLRLHPEQQRNMVWIDMGKDTKLEVEILKRISSMTKKGNDEGLVMRDEL